MDGVDEFSGAGSENLNECSSFVKSRAKKNLELDGSHSKRTELKLIFFSRKKYDSAWIDLLYLVSWLVVFDQTIIYHVKL